MIAMARMLSTVPRRGLLLGAAALAACTPAAAPPGPLAHAPVQETAHFVMGDGMRLPYRAWLPPTEPHAVLLALHGFNDSRDAWELPAPALAAQGIALYAPDQRGFGATQARGLWPGADALADDALAMLALLRARHPKARLVAMGESMGAAVLMHMATSGSDTPADGLILLAPAVWGRANMNLFMQAGLWLIASVTPGLTVTRAPGIRITASSNTEALRALGRNPLTIRATRFDTLRGLVDLMDLALAAAPRMPPLPTLALYGAQDEIIPKLATRATWSRLPGPPIRRLYYREGYHLLLRDLARAAPLADIAAWLGNAEAPLPSGAEAEATAWLANPS